MHVKTLFYTLALFGSLASPALASEPSQTVVDFTGELVDQNAAPVSGVLPLEFKIYTDEKSKKPIATERHFIAVVDGSYAIALGESSQIKTTKSELYVAVLLDGKELMRQKVAVQNNSSRRRQTKSIRKRHPMSPTTTNSNSNALPDTL